MSQNIFFSNLTFSNITGIVVGSRQLLGIKAAYEWSEKGTQSLFWISIDSLGVDIPHLGIVYPEYSVFVPNQLVLVEMLREILRRIEWDFQNETEM